MLTYQNFYNGFFSKFHNLIIIEKLARYLVPDITSYLLSGPHPRKAEGGGGWSSKSSRPALSTEQPELHKETVLKNKQPSPSEVQGHRQLHQLGAGAHHLRSQLTAKTTTEWDMNSLSDNLYSIRSSMVEVWMSQGLPGNLPSVRLTSQLMCAPYIISSYSLIQH